MLDRLRVLTYHRVAPLNDPDILNPTLISATPDGFERQMRILASGYNVVEPAQLIEELASGRPVPRNAVLVTFDDAYRDFADHAWPIMKKLGLPATVFVSTAFPGERSRVFWWDRLYYCLRRSSLTCLCDPNVGKISLVSPDEKHRAYRVLRESIKSVSEIERDQMVNRIVEYLGIPCPTDNQILDWDRLKGLSLEGVTLGPHSVTHPLLTQVSQERAREEVRLSHRDLRERIGKVVPVFSYPNGDHNDSVVEIVRSEGFQLGFTTSDGPNFLRSTDPLRLRRINITPRTDDRLFRFRLTLAGQLMDTIRH